MAKHVLEQLELKDKLSGLLEDKPKTPLREKKIKLKVAHSEHLKKKNSLSFNDSFAYIGLTVRSRAEYSYDFAAARGGEGEG